MTTFVLAGGCFWCLDAVYRALDGVTEVVSGYTGGSSPDPTYDEVVTGSTGHAESVRVAFDPAVLPADVVLDVFYTVHDPRQLDRQGADVGSQYRSATFAADEAQRELFERARERAGETWGGGVVTTVEPLGRFWPAEEEHQDFAEKNPGQGYCVAVARPKVIAVRRAYARYALAT
jgi:peptide-methionine (S)-S-oxide reductase